jgi:hypothetical protein
MQIAVKNPYEVTCPDGTKDISNGIAMPCTGRLGGKSQAPQGVTMKLTCNDGTVSMGDFSNPLGGRVDVPCRNNGGVKSFEKIEDKEPIYYILVTAGVLLAGYFAYKKFKK